MDYQKFIFAQALNIQKPFYIKDINFEKEAGELHIYIDFEEGSKFKCCVCNVGVLGASVQPGAK